MFLVSFLLVAAVAVPEQNLLANPSFQDGIEGWNQNPPQLAVHSASIDGRSALEFSIPSDVAVGYPSLYQEIPAAEGALLEARAWGRGDQVTDGHGVYLAIECVAEDGERLRIKQSDPLDIDGRWTPLIVRCRVPEGAVHVRLSLILHGHGAAAFSEAALEVLEKGTNDAAASTATLTVSEVQPCTQFLGFGAEDDGWIFNPQNAAQGVGPEDWAIYESRIKRMDPDWVRMFFWYKDWNPSTDWKTFTFDSPNMESHYRALEVYQQIGASVNVVGVEWGMAEPFADPEALASAVGALLEYLIKTRGYTCIQYWTLTNEPNLHFLRHAPFDRFVEIHRRVSEEIFRRGLAVRIAGSDETNGGLPWFHRCATDPEYARLTSAIASHRYLQFEDRGEMSYFVRDRLKILDGSKPLVVAEFGFQDDRSGTFENPIMEEYPYAVWTAAFAIDALNQGVAGFSIWCLHEVLYPGGSRMNYGLWNYKDRGWALRPVYHAWENFCRLTEPGDKVLRTHSTAPGTVQGVVVGSTLFWVNSSEGSCEVQVAGFDGTRVTLCSEGKPDPASVETGEVNLKTGSFTAPPMSFGYIR